MVRLDSINKECREEMQRYSDSTLIITLIHIFLKKSPELGKVFFIEKELKKIDEDFKNEISNKTKAELLHKFKNKIKNLRKIEIDLIIENDKYDIIEFKTSVSNNEKELERVIEQIKGRDSDLLHDLDILETGTIIFMCHKDDSDKIINLFNKKIEREDLIILRKVSFLEWIQGHNKERDNCIYIEFKKGGDNNSKLINFLKSKKICYKLNDLYCLRQSERFKITGKKPPRQYLLWLFKSFLKNKVYDVINQPDFPKEYCIPYNLNEIKQMFVEEYTNKFSKPKAEWVSECIFDFQRLKLIRIENDQIYINLIELTKQRKYKDDDKLFCHFCAKERHKLLTKKIKKQKRTEREEEEKRERLKSESLSKYLK